MHTSVGQMSAAGRRTGYAHHPHWTQAVGAHVRCRGGHGDISVIQSAGSQVGGGARTHVTRVFDDVLMAAMESSTHPSLADLLTGPVMGALVPAIVSSAWLYQSINIPVGKPVRTHRLTHV